MNVYIYIYHEHIVPWNSPYLLIKSLASDIVKSVKSSEAIYHYSIHLLSSSWETLGAPVLPIS